MILSCQLMGGGLSKSEKEQPPFGRSFPWVHVYAFQPRVPFSGAPDGNQVSSQR